MPERTLQQAADELHTVVMGLTELLKREYPSRREVERRFQSKKSVAKNWKIMLSIILVSTCLSFLGTVSTISGCFLTNTPSAGCRYLPGFTEAQERNERRLKIFEELYVRTETNDKRLDKIEKLLKEERAG